MKKAHLIFIIIILLFSLHSVAFAASKPSAPTINSGSSLSNTSIKITWGAVSGATKYRVDLRRTDESDYRTVTSSCTSTSYTATGLTPGSTYYFRVYAINSAGTSSRSTTFEVHTLPNAPTISSVSKDPNGGLSLTLTWNSVSGATNYKILYRSVDRDSYSTLAENITGTSYTHSGLISGAKYCYRVCAVREGNYGNEGSRTKISYTSAQSDTKANYANMSRPDNKIDNNAPNNVILSWKPLISDESFAYDIYRKGPYDGDFIYLARTNSTTYTDTSATPGIIYKYKIDGVATNPYAWRTWTNEFFAAPKITNAISLIPYSSNQMKIEWKAPASETPLTYIIHKRNGSEFVQYATTTETSFIDSGLTYGATYEYYVQVRDRAHSDHYLTSTYQNHAVLQPANIGDGFYASILTNTGNLPVKCRDGNVFLGDNENTGDTLWRFDRDINGSYKLTSATNGEVMDAWGWETVNGTNVTHAAAHDDETKTNQRWFLYEQDGGYVLYPSYSNTLVLDVSGANLTNGTNIQLWERNNGVAQVYQIRKKSNIGTAPYLNVQTGTASSNTKLSWNGVNGAECYTVLIYKDYSFYKEENIWGLEYSEVLPVGSYSARVTARNAFTTAPSNEVTFTVGCTHQYGEWTTQTQPTCENNGIKVRTCKICGSTDTESIIALGHDYQEHTTPATCTEDGETKLICSRCKDIKSTVMILAKGHDFETISHTESTCIEEGSTVSKCKNCDVTKTEKFAPLGHTFTDWNVTKEANCNESGERVRNCTVCDEEEREILNKTEHIYERVKGASEGTEAPRLYYVCKLCGDTIKTDEPYIPDPIVEGELIVGSSEATRGNIITVPISLIQNPGITSFAVELEYDKNVFNPIPNEKDEFISYGNLLKDEYGYGIGSLMNFKMEDANENTVITWTNNEVVEGDGELFSIKFKVSKNAEIKDYPIRISYGEGKINKDDTEVKPNIVNGSVKVTQSDFIRGDIDRNGFINGQDCILLGRYLVLRSEEERQSFFSDYQRRAANVYTTKINPDELNLRDGIRLAQLVAGYEFDDEDEANETNKANDNISLFAFNKSTVLTIGNTTAKVGEMVEVPVIVSDNAGFAGFDLKFNYDSRYLKAVNVINGEVLDNIDCECEFTGKNHNDGFGEENAGDYLRVIATSSNNTIANGELFRIVFEVTENAQVGDGIQVELDYDESSICNVDNEKINDIYATATSGSVNVLEGGTPYAFDITNADIIQNGSIVSDLPQNGDFDLNIDFVTNDASVSQAKIITAFYGENGKLIDLVIGDADESIIKSGEYTQHIIDCNKNISEVKIFIWSSMHNQSPLAESYEVR